MVIRCNCESDNLWYEDNVKHEKRREILVDDLIRMKESFNDDGSRHIGIDCPQCKKVLFAESVSELKRLSMRG